MSEARREKRASKKAPAFETKNYSVGGNKIALTDKKVDINMPHKKVTYTLAKAPREYMNFSMIFQGDDVDSDQTKAYVDVLLGLETLPSYAHTDATLAKELMDVVIENFAAKLNQEPRGDSPEELDADAQALLQLQVEEMLNGE